MILVFFISCIVLKFGVITSAVSESNVYPVYPAQVGRSAVNISNTMDLVVGTMYKVKPFDPLPVQPQSRSYDSGGTDLPEKDGGGTEEDVYLVGLKEACRRNLITSCWTYNGLTFIQSLLQPMPLTTFTGRSTADDVPRLVGLPFKSNRTITILGRSTYWGLGDIYHFLERQVSRFVQGHGVIFPASSWEEAIVDEFQTPVIMTDDNSVEDARSSRHKVKKKSILFPLLVLFKFFKIKMILLPILLTVLLVKKLLIVTLALAPNLMGFFRVCRPPFTPPFGLAPAGLLQDVTDSRGEFSTLYNNYASPYRDTHSYRNRDFGRYAPDTHRQPAGNDVPQDY